MTASAPRPSNSATAWRAAVEPMSPRFASITTGTSAGIAARSRSSAASPAEPNASKNARFGLTAAAYGRGGLEERAGRTPRRRARSRLNPSRQGARGPGSRPRHRTVPVAADRAASRSRYVTSRSATARARRRHGRRRSRRGRRRRGRSGGRRARPTAPAARRRARTSSAATRRRARRPWSGRPSPSRSSCPARRRAWPSARSTIVALEVEERDRVAGRRPDRRERVVVVRDAAGAPCRVASRIDDVGPEGVGLRRGDVAAVGRVRRRDVARAGERGVFFVAGS